MQSIDTADQVFSCKALLLACYDKYHFQSQEAVGWQFGTSDIYKQDLLKEFFKILQKTPHQMQITFRTLYSKFKKKNLSDCNFFDFFLWIQIAFGETIPKRYNTWGPKSYIRIWVGGGWVVGGWLVGGCGQGQVAKHKTPSVIPFWNYLTKCNLNPKEKVKKIKI